MKTETEKTVSQVKIEEAKTILKDLDTSLTAYSQLVNKLAKRLGK